MLQQQRTQADFGGLSGGGGPGAPVVGGAYYAGGQETIQGVALTPGWVVLAEFDLDVLPASAVLDAIGLVSGAALQLSIKLYDVTLAADVAGSTLTSVSLTGQRMTSADIVAGLVLNNRYQIWAECTGGAGPADFAVVRYAVLALAP